MTNYSFEPAHKDMGRHVKSGILNSGIVQIIKMLCQMGSVVVLSRLLPPADFGLLAMVSPVYGFVTLFQDLGLSQTSIHKPNLTHDEVNAFFWLNMVIGLLLTVLTAALSPVIGWYYGEPRVVPLTAAMSLLIFLGCFGNQPCAILTRRMQFGALSITGMVGAVAGLVVPVILALILKNYWALYFGMLAGTLIPIIGVWIAAGWKPSAPRRVPGIGAMLKFGMGVTGANLASFIARNTDNVLIGHRWGDNILGLYDRAYKLLLFPLARVVGPIVYTMIPVLSRLPDEPDRYRGIYLKTMEQLALAVWPGIIWAIVMDDTLVPTLLGAQWTASAPLFRPLAIAGFLQVVNCSAVCLFISQGRSGELARWGIFEAATCVGAFLIGLPYGAFGVATIYALSECLRTPLLWLYITRKGPVRARDMLHAFLPQLAGAVITYFILLAYRNFIYFKPILFLAVGLILSYLAMALAMCISPQGRTILGQSLNAARQVVQRKVHKER